MSDTPRTDELLDDLARPFEDYEIGVLCEHARTLERKLNEAKAEIERLREELESRSFDLSPAMVQTRNDQLNEQLGEARKALRENIGTLGERNDKG